MKYRAVLGAMVLCSTLLADVSAPVIADTSVSASNLSLTGGASTILPVSADRIALLKFDVASALPPGVLATDIVKATLRLYVTHVGAAGAFDVNPAAVDWNEATATGTNAVPDQSLLATFTVAREQQFVFADVTSMVQRWVTTPALNHGLTIRASGFGQATSAYLDSKESTSTSHPAGIEIVIAKPAGVGPAGAQGPQGAPGPAGPNGQDRPRLLPWVSSGAKQCVAGSCAVFVSCADPQATVVAGGCGQVSGVTDALNIVSSIPTSDQKMWFCQVVNVVGGLGALASYEGYVRCVK